MNDQSAATPPQAAPVAVVTGAAGNIGRRLLDRLATAGYRVVGLDLPGALPAGDARFRGCDITDDAEVRTVLAAVVADLGRIDVLVNNAGISAIGRFEDHDVAVHRRVVEVNHLGAIACTQAALPALRRSGGRVVVIGSVTGFAPVLGRPAYVGAKHAVTGLFEALRIELAPDGVGVTLVHPTFVTGGMGEAGPRASGRVRATTGAEVTADDVARAVVEAVRSGRDRVLVGRTAWLSWHLYRHAPALYTRLMKRRLARTAVHGDLRGAP
ncbi:SDR family NAD(P)-dependent oxidoreductase [Nocardioides sambongensis]|uniref:SDR family NAD(P)-dependent oxidoreductase n=1 Tax=Nocardioides sambongensis TaxID=2589074 RepID=UPI0015E835BF|nr:SDR family NAD(P)-dependent oxidoreductase [Nocardioides sambongensis]